MIIDFSIFCAKILVIFGALYFGLPKLLEIYKDFEQVRQENNEKQAKLDRERDDQRNEADLKVFWDFLSISKAYFLCYSKFLIYSFFLPFIIGWKIVAKNG